MRINIFRSEWVLSQITHFLLSEFGIFINIDLSINTVDFVFWIYGPWIYLNLSCITFIEQVINILYLLSKSFYFLKLKVLFKFVQDFISNTLVNFDWVYFNWFWLVLSNLFDFNTTFSWSNNSGSLCVSI